MPTSNEKYSKKISQNKEKNKIAFCKDFGLNYKKNTILACISFPLTEKNNLDILEKSIEGILEQDINLALIGVGTKKFQDFFTDLIKKNKGRISIISDNNKNRQKIYAASDILLATADTKECEDEIKESMNYGVIPICQKNEFVEQYDGNNEKGNAFLYKTGSKWSFFAAIIKAMENFKFPYDWKTIQKNAIKR